MNRQKKLLILVLLILASYYGYKYSSGERFTLPFLSSPYEPLKDGIYVITKFANSLDERCLISDEKPFPYLNNINDQMCGYSNVNDMLQEGKSIWIVKCVDKTNNKYLIANGYSDFNKCLTFTDGGKSKYPTMFSWNYSNSNICGLDNDSILQSNGEMIWTIQPIGKNKYTIINYSNPMFAVTNSTNVWAGNSPAQATSAPIAPSDFNNAGQIAVSNATSVPIPYCLAIDDNEIIPKRFFNLTGPSTNPNNYSNSGVNGMGNQNLCGFNSFTDLINDSRASWNFYKILDI